MESQEKLITKRALVDSEVWVNLLKQYPALVVAAVPPLDMSDWSMEDHFTVRGWARTGGVERLPHKLKSYIVSLDKEANPGYTCSYCDTVQSSTTMRENPYLKELYGDSKTEALCDMCYTLLCDEV